ncbi:GNAT family N-acetyltransferase [Roseomonas sp. CCTCC AB2023176]|uniref:bifunctional helix-turn-helix transcriptional regulator/GNAT family N-acetyltransferase n=1 Tax=Roseomonas sp. CCTCC AB2023176 TaxID=3342640 RepID=UPI0035DD119D
MLDEQVAALRRASRALTRAVGALGPLPGGDLPLTEARVLFELAASDASVARDLAAELALDEGHLSRILARFGERGWLDRPRDERDTRRRRLVLTAAGRDAFARLDRGARDRVAALLAGLPEGARGRLATAAGELAGTLGTATPDIRIRRHGPGDLGWVVERHGALYAAEHGLDGRFEALVARICADFLERGDGAAEAAFIAERDGVRLGSVMLARVDAEVAKLRLLILDPGARGLGLGKRLVAAAEEFARGAGYRRMTLWTMGHLAAARGTYAAAGWALASAREEEGFGRRYVSEEWVRGL